MLDDPGSCRLMGRVPGLILVERAAFLGAFQRGPEHTHSPISLTLDLLGRPVLVNIQLRPLWAGPQEVKTGSLELRICLAELYLAKA